MSGEVKSYVWAVHFRGADDREPVSITAHASNVDDNGELYFTNYEDDGAETVVARFPKDVWLFHELETEGK